MTGAKLLDLLQEAGVQLWVEDEGVRYRAPKGVLTESLRAEIATRKTEILQLLQENKQPAHSTFPPLVRIARGGEQLPLSFAQERLWFINQLDPDSPAYNISWAFRARGRLHVTALERTFNEIVRRHEIFRTTCSMVNGRPIQVISPILTVPLPVVDLRQIGEVEREATVRRLTTEEASQPFDFVRGPLLRVRLLQLDDDDHVLLLTTHHFVIDGWSFGVFFQEISTLYEAFSTGKSSPLPDLVIQYADFAQWQRQSLRGDILDDQIAYWKKQLAGAPALLELPTDRLRPPTQSYRGAFETVVLSRNLSEALKQLSRQERVTLFMTLLAAFQTLLYRYTAQSDVIVGTGVSNRNRTEVEGLIGAFANNLVLRTDVSGNPTFRALLRRVGEVAIEAYAHQDLPFQKLVEELQLKRNLAHHPLFQVVFVHHQQGAEQILRLKDLSLSWVPIETGITEYDLLLLIVDGPFLSGGFNYNTDLFEASSIQRMRGHFQTLLEGIVANPEQRISDLPLLTKTERNQLLVEWNDTKREYPNDKCLHELFEAQVEKSPDAVAVTLEDEQLTYRELNARANQLAHHLQTLGVGPEVLVGVCMVRSLEMVMALLGILKAGGAYVPLDPEYPKERLAFMMRDAQVTVLLTQARLLTCLPDSCAKVVCLDRDYGKIAQESVENTITNTMAENLAYVMYTSGSTGQPKGVEVLHRGVVRLLFEVAYVQLSVNETFLQLSPNSFDASTFEIWGALLHGAKCVLFSGKIPSPDEIGDILHHYRISTLWLTAALFNTVIDDAPHALSGVRQLLIGGEALSVRHVQRAIALLPHTQIVNGYGPTESTTFACCYPIPVQLHKTVSSIPIGRPIANTETYLLDRHLSPVPIGVCGELYIGGDGLARGYLKRPDLTAEKFVPNPFSNQPGGRLYRTGDLARYLTDGNIEFLGRIDHQVKIRGFRIEPGEVESVLSQHPAVRECVVISREEVEETDYGVRLAEGVADNPQSAIANPKFTGKRLVAYVVPRCEPVPTISELRGFVKEKLPEYMVPSAFVFLDSLPLTPNGKIDRKAVPALDQSRPELKEDYVAPRTPMEEMIAEIWAEVLKLDTVGVHDSFFDLGGHSLLATQAMSRIRQVFKMELPLRALFERATVAELAKHINEACGEEQTLPVRPMVPVSRDKDLPLSFSQQRLWFLDQYEPNSSVYNIPSALRLRGSLDIGALEQSLNEVIRRHESLRTTFSMVNGGAVQVIAPSVGHSLAVVDRRDHPGGEREEEARRLVSEEARRPFDLTQGPLFRSKLLRLGEDDHVLLLTLHHIVSDGWSMGVLYRELSVLYEAFSHSRPSPLPELPVQYADFAVWQRELLKGDELERQLSYWKKQLAGIPAVWNLPTDHPRPAIQSHCGAHQSIELSKELSEGLKALSLKEGATLFMTLLAAFKILLSRYTGQEDIVVGSPIANRNRTEIEGLIGFLVNTLVLRTNFAGDPTFKELLARVRETTLGAYAHQDLPFERLVEELQPERSLSHSPLFQVFFNMLNLESYRAELHGLTAEPLFVFEPDSKFDLTLYAGEKNGGIHLTLVYNADLFDTPTITGMLGCYHNLLDEIVAKPEQPIANLLLWSEFEKEKLIIDFNQDLTQNVP